MLRRKSYGLPRQGGRQGTTRWLAALLPSRGGRGSGSWINRHRFGGGLTDLEILKPKFKLIDLAVEFLRTASELHSLQLEYEELQVFDFGLLRRELGLLHEHQRLQRFRIESVEFLMGSHNNGHVIEYATFSKKVEEIHKHLHKKMFQTASCGTDVLVGLLQSIPSSNIES